MIHMAPITIQVILSILTIQIQTIPSLSGSPP